MKRTISAAMLAGGVLSMLVCAAPATAAPSDVESISCAEYSSQKLSDRVSTIKDLLEARPGHKYGSKPTTVVRKVDAGCKVARKRNAGDTVRVAKLVDELNRGNSSSDRSSSTDPSSPSDTSASGDANTKCSVWLKMKRPEQAALLQQHLVRPGSKFDGRFNTAAALVDGECNKLGAGATVAQAYDAVMKKHDR
ncbi:hypothetical protein OH799_00705 [Nocardia sp. NBC_00881]|uniref:hypothetical protein n=1 Tax=Nocardia sp. NBC_00881 TaxID=2975995 RepID=UPI00386B1C54|nr:hypothetical protein OH799_00705 [Nocardia sp. NBC_00881]